MGCSRITCWIALYGKGDADGDGEVTAAEAKGYLDRHMTRAARRAFGRHQHAGLIRRPHRGTSGNRYYCCGFRIARTLTP